MKFFTGLLFGVIIAFVAYFFMEKKAKDHPEAEQRFEDSANKAGTAATEAAQHLSDALKAKFETLDLGTDEVKQEMADQGKIIRRKAEEVGNAVRDEASDARIVTEIKAKYAKEPDLSVWAISVSCHQGHVALSGSVPNPEGVSKAVTLALEPKGVEDVTSTLAIKEK
jgi:hyperosmotically inducible periplasmic protein